MKINIFIILVVFSFSGCSEKEPSPKIILKEKLDVKKTVAVIMPTVSTEMPTSEFIPEHIKRSRIEVVKHY